MKHFIDGDQLVIVQDDFIDLRVSPAVFFPLESETAKVVLKNGIRGLPLGDLLAIRSNLKLEGGIETEGQVIYLD